MKTTTTLSLIMTLALAPLACIGSSDPSGTAGQNLLLPDDDQVDDNGGDENGGDDDCSCGEADLPYDAKLAIGQTFKLTDAFLEKGPLPAAVLSVEMDDPTWRLAELASNTPFVVDQADCDHEGNRDVGRDRIIVTWQNSDGSTESDHLDMRYCEGGGSSGSSSSSSGGGDDDHTCDCGGGATSGAGGTSATSGATTGATTGAGGAPNGPA